MKTSSSFPTVLQIQVEQEAKIPVTYTIKVLPVTGAEIHPLPGNYVRAEGSSFILDIYVDDRYDASAIALRINNDTIRTILNIPGTSMFTHTIYEISEDKELEVLGLKEIPPVSNEIPEHEIKIYTSANNLYVQTVEPTEMFIYTILGTCYMHKQISEGVNVVQLEPGVYIVVVNGKSYKVVVK